MIDTSCFQSQLNQILEKHKIDIFNEKNNQLNFDLLNDINNLLVSNDLNFQQEKKSIQEKLKNYVLSTLKFSSLSNLISGVAHEINTPLAIIQIRTDQLFEATQVEEFNKESFEKSLISIDQTAKRIGTIVTRLRSYSKSLNNEEISRVSIKKLIEDTAALTRDRFLTEGVTLEIIPSPEDCEIECRVSDISQALLNVFNNSFTAVKSQNEKWIRVSYAIKDKSVFIEVTDDGPGVPQEARSRVFEPYFTTSVDNHTLGLGLTIARDYIVAHQGSLLLDETSTKAKFIFSLPLADTFNFGL